MLPIRNTFVIDTSRSSETEGLDPFQVSSDPSIQMTEVNGSLRYSDYPQPKVYSGGLHEDRRGRVQDSRSLVLPVLPPSPLVPSKGKGTVWVSVRSRFDT